jgi:signal peptidase II
MMRGFSYPFGGIGIFEQFYGVSFSLNTVTNTGVAWGLFPGHAPLLLALRAMIIAGLLIYLLWNPKKASLSLWMIAAGATGNVIDMLVYGHVIDFLHFQFFGWSFPLFNLADSCIAIGAFLLLLPRKIDDRSIKMA